MPIIKNVVNITSLITTNVTNNINNYVNASGILEPVVNGLVVPMIKHFGPGAIMTATYTSTGCRTGKAVIEYYEGKCSLRNPRFWIRTGAALCTGGSALLQTYTGISALTGCKAEWAAGAGMSLEAAAETLEKKLNPVAILGF
jgi:hypothetical protein